MIDGRRRGWRQAACGVAVAALVAGSLIAVLGSTPAHRLDDRALYTSDELAAIERHSPLPKLPTDPTDRVADSASAAKLGQFLFFDPRFSANGKVSCSTCHRPALAFTDGRALAKGIAIGTRNAPSLLNAVYNHWFFWDGRTDSQWAQALQPPEAPREFGGDRLAIAHAIAANAALRAAYEHVFGTLPPLDDTKRFPAHARPDTDPHSALARAWAGMALADRRAVNRVYSNFGKAIEAYERELVSADAPFDIYAAGLRSGDPAREGAISSAAKRGLKLFVGAGHCDLCHAGPLFSDGQFHNIGLPLQPGEKPDPGRAAGISQVRADIFNGTGAFSDDPAGAAKQKLEFLPPAKSQLGAFKTPSLRNVALTAPYMHDGRFATLAAVMDFYAKGKAASRGRLIGTREATLDLVPHFTTAQQADLVAFLKTLSGKPVATELTRPPPSP